MTATERDERMDDIQEGHKNTPGHQEPTGWERSWEEGHWAEYYAAMKKHGGTCVLCKVRKQHVHTVCARCLL
jgi:hypothetical protein